MSMSTKKSRKRVKLECLECRSSFVDDYHLINKYKNTIDTNVIEMDSDFKTKLAVSLIQNKPEGMNIMEYVSSVQSKIMKKDSGYTEVLEKIIQGCSYDSETNNLSNQQSIKENESLSYVSKLQDFEKHYSNNMVSPEKNNQIKCAMSSVSTFNFIKNPNTCLVQPVNSVKTLNEITKIPSDTGYNTNDWKMNTQDSDKNPISIMLRSLQNALDHLTNTLFDISKLLEAVINWNHPKNCVRYFANLVSNMAESKEFGFTCRDHMMMFIQNTALKILDNHHRYNSIHVEYQCNLLAKFCYDKYIRWSIIHLLINRLKNDVQIVSSSSSLQSIFYTFYLIDNLLNKTDFIITTTMVEEKGNLTDMWNINHIKKNGNEIEKLEQMLKEWKALLEYISMETLNKNIFMVCIKANQCLDYLKSITSK